MLVFYVIGLPVAALLRVRNMHRTTVMDPEEEKIYGMFYTAFRKETWWWEITVAARKIVIALIGVFGAEMGDMQVHLTLMLVMFILLVTSQIRPFGGLKHGILHVLEMASLMATFLTLWAGSIFNTRPRCEDPLQGEGSTLLWCDALSIVVGLVDIVVLLAIGISFVYIKATSSPDDEGGDIKGDVEMVGFENPMKKLGEMKEVKKGNSTKESNSNFPGHLIVAGEEKSEKKERKERKEKSKITKRRNSFRDPTSGKLYHHNEQSGKTEWLTGTAIPKGFRAGQNMSITTLSGGTIDVVIPQGYSEGDTMHVNDAGLVYDEPLYRGQLIKDAQKLQTEEKNSSSLQAIADEADKSAAVVCHAVAMYDFDGSNSNGRNISFKAGAIIEVNEMGE